MTKVIFGIILTLITLAVTHSAKTRTNDPMTKEYTMTTTTMNQDASIDTSNLDMEAIMNSCNESFRIEMAYLESLNESGSFIDETERTPKCFIRCVLENAGVLTEDRQINPARAAIIFAGERNGKAIEDIADMTAMCSANRDEKCLCEKSYQFLKCLMSMEIEKYEKAQ